MKTITTPERKKGLSQSTYKHLYYMTNYICQFKTTIAINK